MAGGGRRGGEDNLFKTKAHRKERKWSGWDEAEKGREAEWEAGGTEEARGREIN